MGNLTVAVLGKLGYSSNLAKKGTSTDITLYNLKKGEDVITFIEPTRYPDRLAPLFYACSLANKAIVVVDGAQSVPHIKTDVKEIDCDFLCFSAFPPGTSGSEALDSRSISISPLPSPSTTSTSACMFRIFR